MSNKAAIDEAWGLINLTGIIPFIGTVDLFIRLEAPSWLTIFMGLAAMVVYLIVLKKLICRFKWIPED